MIVQSLWIGEFLTNMEILCIKSFLLHEHEFHLYTYDTVANVPHGVIILDANEIYPRDKIFTLKEQYLPFSDIWRYNLLRIKGGIWVDLDMVCVGNLNELLDHTFVFSSERTIQRGAYKMSVPHVANIGFLKAPIQSQFYIELCDKCEKIEIKGKNTDKIRYMRVLRNLIKKYNYEHYIAPPKAFCPIDWWYAKDLFFKKDEDLIEKYGVPPHQDLLEGTYTVHLWRNLATHKYHLNLNGEFPPESIFSRFATHFL